MRSIVTAAAVLMLAGHAASAQEFNWGPAPAIFPAGAKMAVLQGDPSKAEYFTVRLDFPANYVVAPHWHPTDEMVTVIKGTFLVGMGDKVDAKATKTVQAGGFGKIDARMHHYAIARSRTIVQVSALGPFQLTYVNPADDPTKKTASK